MGNNTTVVVYNDALDALEKDRDFGASVAVAVRTFVSCPQRRVDIPSGSHANAAVVVDCHHADQLVPVLVGGNLGYPVTGLHLSWREENRELRLLQELADKLGYELKKRCA